jgi:uncharacterized protein YcfJ
MSGRWVGRVFGLVFALGTGLSTGCSTMNNTEKGALGGGAIGAGVGTLVGAATGNPRTGAAVGAAIGAGVGGLAGNDMDREERERTDAVRLAEAQAASQAKPLGMIDVVQMANTNPPPGDEVIINAIRQSRSTYQLSPTDIAYLKQNNVSDRVIVEMQNSGGRVAIGGPPRTVVVHEPTTVIYERPYYRPYYCRPPPPIGFGVVIRR